ncbi:MAG: hypothetical protein H7039_18375 [Bryobacteraceae bacterium]|nr:hypothetical protein [Bryobacteraceae bacterium]
MRLFPVLLFFAGSMCAADLSREDLLLQRARLHMSNTLSSLPNYTCLQTIERSHREAPKRKPALIDVVRIEVALVNGKELFAWPGSGKFLDTEITDLVSGGAIGNGSFALHAKAVFQSNVPTFTYAGESFREGRRSLKWTFVVPQIRSGFTLRVGRHEAVVGYHGAFWIDAVTRDTVRLEVEADDIPPKLLLMAAADAVEYLPMKIGAEDFLLPSMAELRMTGLDGTENMNRTRFSKCRQYSGESKLSFEDPEPESQAETQPARDLQAPAGLTLDLAIDSAVSLRGAAVGDPVTARLERNLKLPDGTVLPRGAFVHGRLTHFRPAYTGRYQVLAVGMKFFEIESGNTRVHFDSTLVDLRTPNPAYLPRGPLSKNLSAVRVENEALLGSIFYVKEYMSSIEKGLRMIWRTTAEARH